jgi:predicted transcriptional regulator
MGVISVRFNPKEEKVLNYLAKYYDKEKSSLIKQSLIDMYEDIVDREEINRFIVKKGKEKAIFKSADEILSTLDTAQSHR